MASHTTATTRPSSKNDSPQLEKGSGEVFTAARVVIFVASAVAESDPPSSPATTAMVALSAPNTP
ncbi:hypothetical protein D3C71_2085110 [compost metagenome]